MVGPLSILLPFWLGLSVGFLLYKFFLNNEEPKNLPLGSMGWPLVGETLHFLEPHRSNTMGKFLQDRCSRYGRVFKSHLFGSPTIVSCDLELNMFILQNEEKLFQGSYPKPIHGVLGKLSMLVVVRELHKKLRSVALSFFTTCKTNPNFITDMDGMLKSMMESWKDCKEFTFNLMVKQFFSMGPKEPLVSQLLEDYMHFMKGLVSLPIYIPGTYFAKAVKARMRICTTIREIIKGRREGNNDVGQTKGDFLDVILSNVNLSDEERVSIVLDLLLGGYETTSTLMSLLVYFLAHSHHALEQLKDEHQAIRKRKHDGEALSWEDYKEMHFTINVIHEALRCGNVVKFVHRKALKDIEFKGFLIPAGWKVLPILLGAHLDPKHHENPSEFNPWRWNDQTTIKKVSPFAGGLRQCPGSELGKLEAAFFLHHLVLNYRWKIIGDDHPMCLPYIKFKGGLRLEIEQI
ncbi:Cytochrome P450 [Dillenia turbinata]|uniref:Cytochrome P450 724B1 n=1 Tax=Dillenia turbinata TaxID=194707 RepID=A0AAN8U9V6_9MAGN